MKCGNWKPWCT